MMNSCHCIVCMRTYCWGLSFPEYIYVVECMTMDEEEELPVRKRSSTQTLLVDNDKIQLPNKSRRRSSWQFIDVVDSPTYKNSADFRELYFQFPEDQVQWLYRVDGQFLKAAKVIRDSIKDHNFKETVVDIYESQLL